MKEFTDELQNVVGNDHCIVDDDGFQNFINEDFPDPYDLQVDIPDRLPDVDKVIDQSDADEKAANTYHSFVGAEVIVPDAAGKNRRMARVLLRQIPCDSDGSVLGGHKHI
jgi:hypothetical protein